MKHSVLAASAAVITAVTVFLSAQTVGLEYHYFNSEGVQIAFTEKGWGEPVILLHAAMADSEFNWMQFGTMNALAENYRVIAMDLRGHGNSGKPHDPKAYGRLMVRDVIGLMDHLKIPRAHLLGYSLGSHIAMALVSDHPDRIISAAFGGPTWIHPGGKDLEPLPPEEYFAKMNDEVFGGRNDIEAVMHCLRSQADWAVTEEAFQTARVPCLFIFGTKDENRKHIPGLRKAMAEYATFVDIEGAGHGDAIVHPEFLKAVLRFIGDHPVSKGNRM